MISKEVDEKILNDVAPCSLFCLACTGCKYGSISNHAKELLRLLEGHEEFLDKNLSEHYRHKLDEFKEFQAKLRKYANPKCGGCRNGGAHGCSIKGCIIPECVKEHGVNFCGECSEFPCNKVNDKIYKENVIKKWMEGNMKIRNEGIESYYKENKDIPHYIEHKK